MKGAVALIIFVSFALSFNQRTVDGYLITVPRRWTLSEKTQLCVSLTDGETFAEEDSLEAVISVHASSASKVISKETLRFTSGESEQCAILSIPEKTASNLGFYHEVTSLDLMGNLAGHHIVETMNVTINEARPRTFIQTDKYLYKPGQTVEFRVLSVGGPFLNVQTNPLKLVYIENPSNTRIQQWLNVDNRNGLVHLSFTLSDEVEEGFYQIIVKTENGEGRKSFKVEDYILPRYEITINPLSVILATDKTVDIEMCAKYTYGEDVKGNATLNLIIGSWIVYANESQSKPISGCTTFTFETKNLRFDDNNCHIRVNNFKVRGVVVEEGTDTELVGEKHGIKVVRRVINFQDKTPNLIKKTYMPTFVKIEATFSDGKIAPNEKMKVCTHYHDEHICKNFTTCNKGYLSFIAPQEHTSTISVTAVKYPKLVRNWNNVMEESSYNRYRSYGGSSYVDPSNSSLTIYDKSELKCTNGNPVKAIIPVVYFVKNDVKTADVFVQVLSRGQVQFFNKMKVDFIPGDLPYKDFDVLIESRRIPADVTKGTFNIYLDLTATVSTEMKLLIWFTNQDGIVVADTASINVANCLPHNVDMNWSVPKAEPGTKVDLSVTGAKNSLCSVGVVDKSVELLSNQHSQYLNINDLLQSLHGFDVSNWDDHQLNLKYCLLKFNGSLDEANLYFSAISEEEKLVYEGYSHSRYHRRNRRNEALHMFRDAGYFVLTDQTVQKQFCYNEIINAIKAEERRKEQELNRPPPHFKSSSVQRVSYSSSSHSGPQGNPGMAHSPQYDSPSSIMVSHSSPVVPAYEGSSMIEQEQERLYLPETWLWNLINLSDAGLSTESLTIPDTITEWVGRTVCVHPTEGVGISDPSSVVTFTHFFTDLTLPSTIKRGEILPLKVSVFNYYDEDLPVKLVLKQSSGYETVEGVENERNICVSAKDKWVETIRMKFLELGDVNITVEASVDHNSPLSCGSGSPSIYKIDRLIRPLPVEAEGILRQRTWTKYVCVEDIVDVTKSVEHWTIAAPSDIVQGSDRAWITATGDLMGPTIENIGRIVDYPSGCGEQNMVNFAPNVYIKRYLETTNQLTDQINEKIDLYLKRGYQRQLRYRHSSDGSFSSFGSRDSTGSTWLTAFVLKSFNQARPYTYIDQNVLLDAASYLHNKQDNVTGCYLSEGRVIHKSLQGGVDKGGNRNVLLSAYVLATLGSLGPDLDLNTSRSFLPSKEVILKGISCIENDDSTHPYNLALRAYSLAQNKASSTAGVIQTLLDSAVVTASEMSWDLPEAGRNSALKVETAAYALLALITHDYNTYKEQSRKLVRWISGNRNSRGGFISTQDTVVALESLAAFQKVQPAVEVSLTARIHSGNLKHKFKILENNKLVEQRMDLPTVPADVKAFVDGEGCGIVQGVIRYNVLAESPSDAFVLNVEATDSATNCRSRRISACTSYTLSDKVSNMALIEFKLQTGFTVDKQHLREVVHQSSVLKRFEVDRSKVTFYLEEVTANTTCVAFNVHQDIAIDNIKLGYVKVFDYYQPEYETTQNYNFPESNRCNSIE